MLLSTPQFNPNFIAPDFSLPDAVSGKTISLKAADLSNGFVLMFISNHCPYVQAVIEQIVAAAKSLKKEGIPVFAIMSNNFAFIELDSPENMKLFAHQHALPFPYLVDEDQSVARAYDAICTPDIFGFNSGKYMQYRGNIDGLESAMLKIKKTGAGPSKQSASRGCSIKWK